MEAETQDIAETPLEELRAELVKRGWTAISRDDRSKGDRLKVINPAVPSLNDTISCDGDAFRWRWGQGIGPVAEVASVADRIMFVLREVDES